MANLDLVLDYLLSISPREATIAQIVEATGIEPYAQVYQLTRRLLREGLIQGEQRRHKWFFWVSERGDERSEPLSQRPSGPVTARQFEALAGRVLSASYQVPLMPRSVGHIPKQFDFVSPDTSIIGDAKYYTRGGTPSGKLATICEYVWLLEHTGAAEKFLVFGNDRRVPIMWLDSYGSLLSGVTFYFLTDDGDLEELVNPASEGR